MSIDMGGLFNKAAYVFGTASIAAGNYDIMAAVMVGGMVPPCAIALATMLFGCTLMAPHGGIFVFLTVGNPLLYLVALAVGSAVGCVLLGVLKKKTA